MTLKDYIIKNKNSPKTAVWDSAGGKSYRSAVHGGDVFHAPECYCDIYKGLYEIILHTYWKLKEWDDDIFRKTLDKADKTVNTL